MTFHKYKQQHVTDCAISDCVSFGVGRHLLQMLFRMRSVNAFKDNIFKALVESPITLWGKSHFILKTSSLASFQTASVTGIRQHRSTHRPI
jgi:hypothetical protein